MTKTKHTPTPWHNTPKHPRKIVSNDGLSVCTAVLSNFGNVDAETNRKILAEAVANAEFIVKACNAYERDQETIKALTEALKDIEQRSQ